MNISNPSHYIYTVTRPVLPPFTLIMIPKNGCTGLKFRLRSLFGESLDQVGPEQRKQILRDQGETNERMWIHERTLHPYAWDGFSDSPRSLIYLPYRNPTRRLVSAWVDKKVLTEGGPADRASFEAFLAKGGELDDLVHTDPHFMPQSEFASLVPPALKPRARWVNFKKVTAVLGLGDVPPVNEGVKVPASYYTFPAIEDALSRHYERDMASLYFDLPYSTIEGQNDAQKFLEDVEIERARIQAFRKSLES